ncbi:MAG: glycosyltransferase family 39 protein [Planctomycetota bacterium]
MSKLPAQTSDAIHPNGLVDGLPHRATPTRRWVLGYFALALVVYATSAGLALWQQAAVQLGHASSVFAGNDPPMPGDGVDYDSIACSILRGEGFGHRAGDPTFREPYMPYFEGDLAERFGGGYATLLNHNYTVDGWRLIDPGQPKPDVFAPTAFRPPGYPALLAGVYALSDRSFLAVRLLQGVFAAGAATFAMMLAWRFGGPWAGRLAGALMLIEPGLHWSAPQFMTESIAALVVALLAWSIVAAGTSGKARYALLAGATLGVGALFRNSFVLWLPMTAGLIWLAMRYAAVYAQGLKNRDRTPGFWRRPFVLACAAGAIAVAIPAPWWVRNVVLLEAPMPLGTQGGIGLPGGYSEYAYAGYPEEAAPFNLYFRKGVWVYLDPVGFFDDVARQAAERGDSPIESERAWAKHGQAYALDWAKHNPGKVVELVGWRLYRHATGPLSVHVMVLTGVGVLLAKPWRHPGFWVPVGLILVNAAIVGAMWSAGGRFAAAVAPLAVALGSVGLMGFGHRLRTRARPSAGGPRSGPPKNAGA